MPREYTPGGLSVHGNGEEVGVWGDLTDANMQLLEQMTSYTTSVVLSGTTHTLSLPDGFDDTADAQYAALVFTGSPSGTNTVTIAPNDARRIYIAVNESGETVVLAQGSGATVSIPTGESAIVACDGAGSGAAVTALMRSTDDRLTGDAPFTSIDIDGGSIDGAPIGVASASTGVFTTLTTTGAVAFGGSVTGTLATAAQPNITSLGTLSALTVSGLGTFSDLTVSGTATATTLAGTLSTAAQPNVTSVGTLTTLTTSGLITGGAGIAITGAVSGDTIAGDMIASQAEAEAGTATDKAMTPQRTAQAIAALAPGDPVVAPSALNTNLGTGSATAVGTILDVTDLTDVGQVLVYGELSIDAPSDENGTVTVQVAYSTDNGSTFGAASDVPGATLLSQGNTETDGFTYVIALTGSQNAVRFTLATGGGSPQSPSASVTAIGLARK